MKQLRDSARPSRRQFLGTAATSAIALAAGGPDLEAAQTTQGTPTVQLVNVMPGDSVPVRLAYASAIVGTTAYLINVIASFWLPGPKDSGLPD